MSERFFVDSPISQRVTLAGAEAHHLANVMRVKPGDEVRLFDGSGSEFLARVESASKRAVELEIVERRAIDRESFVRLTLAVALPKGERQRWLVEKAVELGVTTLAPIAAEHSVAEASEAAVARLQRTVIEASKQCGRNQLMEISTPLRLGELLAEHGDALRLVAHPGGMPLGECRPDPKQPIVAAIGPEGGFSSAEIDQALAAGWKAVDLGPRTLRVETAAIAVAAWVAFGS